MTGLDLATALALVWTVQTPQTPPTTPPAGQQAAAQTPAAPAAPPDHQPPAATGGTPTVTDAAEMSAPGWLEFDPGFLKDLELDHLVGTPFTLKFTTTNNHLQYLLGTDGYIFQDSASKGWGNTYPGVHYLFLTQDKYGFDVAGKALITLPTADHSVGGTGRVDYNGYILASRDFTKWGFHGDFNLGYSQLSRVGAIGYDQQGLLSGSTTTPLPGGLWNYTNELAYFTAFPGEPYRLTTMHGVSFAIKRYAILSGAIQMAFHGAVPRYQLLLAASFNVTPVGK